MNLTDFLAALKAPDPPREIVLDAGTEANGLVINRLFSRPVVIGLQGCKVRGLVLRGGAYAVEGGTLSALDGVNGKASRGYAVSIERAQAVMLSGATITDAVKGVVVKRRSCDIAISNCTFTGALGDGINITSGRTNIRDCLFDFASPDPEYHSDAIQWFGAGCAGPFTIEGNEFFGRFQGVGGLGSRPVGIPVTIRDNRIAVTMPRAVSVRRERGEVVGNIIGTGATSGTLAGVFMNPHIVAHSNRALDFEARGRKLPAWAGPAPG